MAIEKKIKVNVETGDSEQELKKLEKGFKKVDDAAGKTSKSVDDVAGNGGAIAILDQLTGGLATRMRDAYEASRLFNISLKATRGALIATGIGAFVVALGLVVAYWDDIVNFITQADEKLQKQIDRHYDIGERLSFELKLLEGKEKLLIAEGKSTEGIIKLKNKLLKQQLDNNEANLIALKTQQANALSKALELSTLEKIAKFAGAKIFTTIDEDEKKQLEEITKQIQDAEIASDSLKLSILELNKPDTDTDGGEGKQKRDRAESVSGLSAEGLSPSDDPRVILEQGVADNIIKIKEGLDNKLNAISEREKAREVALSEFKKETALNTLSLIGAIAEEGSAVAKGVQVAQATISGIEGVQGAYTSAQKSPITSFFPAYPLVQAGLAGAFSAVQIQKILSVKPQKGGASGQSVNSGGRGATAPAFNLVSGTGTNQIAETIQNQREPVRAYVVSSEVTSNQSLDRNIKDNSTI